MQRLISLLLCLTPITASAIGSQAAETSKAATLITSDRSKVALSFNFTALNCEQVTDSGAAMEQMVIPGEGCFLREGKPILPAVSRFVVVPPDKSIELVVREGEARRLQANLPLVICNEKPPNDADVMHPSDYPDELIPPVTAEMSEPIVMRGVRLVRVTTYPVQFDPNTQTYVIRDNLEAELRFGDAAPVNPASHPVRRNRSRTFLKYLQGLAINGDEVGRDDPDYDVAPPYVGHYLVVVHAAVLQYAVPFIEWRRKAGYKVDILSVPANQASSSNWIKDHIQTVYDSYLDRGIDPFDLLMLIGDHDEYAGDIPGPQSVLATPSYGWDYACLEGNDNFTEVGLSQWIAGSESQMTLNTGRTLSYEMNPFFNNTAWFRRGALFSQKWGGNWHVSLHLNVRWAREVLERHHFNDIRFYENYEDEDDNAVSNFMIQQFNAGVNVLFGRAQAGGIYGSWGNVNATGIYPIYINYAGHQEAMTWMAMRGWDGRNLKGPVAATNIYGAPQTYSNNMLWLETVDGLIQEDLPFGWARVKAVMAPELYIPNFGPNEFNREQTASYGDPGLQPWLGVPRLVRAELASGFTSTTRRADVQVFNAGDDDPVEGAQVTLYFPGQMPAANRAEYATYDQMFMQTQKSGADGVARFVFDEGTTFVNNTQVFLTVTGRDIKPFLANDRVSIPAAAIEMSSYELTEVEGNGDEFVNPGERFSLQITAKNVGNANSLQEVTAVLSSNSPYLEVAGEQISFGNIQPNQECNGDHPVELLFSADCPDGVSRPAMRPSILVDFASGGATWQSAVLIEPHAPHFEIHRIVSNAIIPDSSSRLQIEITNVGSIPSREVTATVVSLGMGVSVIRARTSYPALGTGRFGGSRGEAPLINGNKVVVPGSSTPMQLILTDDRGFADTVTFSLQVMRPRARAPQGPDAYGYICYDDTDTSWDAAPEYDWVEIDRRAQNAQYEGTQLGFDGQSPLNIGEALVIVLPFTTRFYGVEFDTITVATNGFIAVGRQPDIVNFQNWPLDRGIGGGAGMIAPFWDNLALDQNGEVFTFYDEENGRFIIEWSRLHNRNDNQVELTFEVILSDPALWVSETGDPNILFQYKSIRNVSGIGNAWVNDTPFASVGISSPDGNTGISYTFNNQYPVTSSPLQNRCAILFSTSPLRLASYLYGQVIDARTGEPVPQALVGTRHGYLATTDDEGLWYIANAPSDIPFNITASKLGYLDSTYADLEVAELDTLEINFSLLHPEFTPSVQRLRADLGQDTTQLTPFSIFNGGNGALTWSAEKRLLGEANAAPWETRSSIAVGRTLDDERLHGVVFANDQFYVAGANENDPSLIYILSRDGALLDSFYQCGHSRYGFKDLAWDGSLIWAAGEDTIFAFTTEGEVVHKWRGPYNPSACVAWDSERNLLFVSGITTNITACDVAGNVVGESFDRRGLHLYGLSYWPEDPDGKNLYITAQEGQAPAEIYKMNPITGDTALVHIMDMRAEQSGALAGFLTNQWDVYSWVLMTIDNAGAENDCDQIRLTQLEARKDWFNIDRWSGVLLPDSTQEFTLTFNSTDLPDTLFAGEVRFTHNAAGGVTNIGVSLQVFGVGAAIPPILLRPENGDTITALPQYEDSVHFAPIRFVWLPAHDPIVPDSLINYLFTIKSGEDSVSTTLKETFLSLNIDTLGLPLAFDRPIEWWVCSVADTDTTECRERFTFRIIPDAIDRQPEDQPVSFGINSLYPSPFNSVTTVRFGVDRSARTRLAAYDILGRQMAVLYEGTPELGYLKVAWNAANLASGVYVVRLESAGRVSARKIALIR